MTHRSSKTQMDSPRSKACAQPGADAARRIGGHARTLPTLTTLERNTKIGEAVVGP